MQKGLYLQRDPLMINGSTQNTQGRRSIFAQFWHNFSISSQVQSNTAAAAAWIKLDYRVMTKLRLASIVSTAHARAKLCLSMFGIASPQSLFRVHKKMHSPIIKCHVLLQSCITYVLQVFVSSINREQLSWIPVVLPLPENISYRYRPKN